MFNKANIAMECRKFEARLEDYLGGAPDTELDDHVARCQNCRAMLDDSRLAGDLLRRCLGARERTEPRICRQRYGPNSSGRGANEVSRGILDSV